MKRMHMSSILFLIFLASPPVCYASVLVRQTASEHTIQSILGEAINKSESFDDDGTNFDILCNLWAVSSKGDRLVDHLPGGITLFAPDDNAIRQTARDLNLSASSEKETYEGLMEFLQRQYLHPTESLASWLFYHVVPGEINSTQLAGMSTFSTWDGDRTFMREGSSLIDRNPTVPNARVDPCRTDIEASNGLIHVIDRMLLPTTLTGSSSMKEPTAWPQCSAMANVEGPKPLEENFEMEPSPEEADNEITVEASPGTPGSSVAPSPEIEQTEVSPQASPIPTSIAQASPADTTDEQVVEPSIEATEGPHAIMDLEPTFEESSPETSSDGDA